MQNARILIPSIIIKTFYIAPNHITPSISINIRKTNLSIQEVISAKNYK